VPYIDRIVNPGEAVLVRARPHWVIFLGAAPPLVLAIGVAVWARLSPPSQVTLVAYLGSALLAVVGLVILFSRMLTWVTTEFGVTNHRVIVKRGLISLHTVEMNVDKVESVDVDQTIFGRMLGFGTVTIHGIGARWDPIPQITDPLGFRSAITSH
jgi:uncharacterized membrane protein YdbT with pleckstrin-like domain